MQRISDWYRTGGGRGRERVFVRVRVKSRSSEEARDQGGSGRAKEIFRRVPSGHPAIVLTVVAAGRELRFVTKFEPPPACLSS